MGTYRFLGEVTATCPGCGYSVALLPIVGDDLPKEVICPACGDFCLKESVLTRREIEIVRELSEGYSVAEAGKRLGISHKTVENHRASIYWKLGIKDLPSLTKYALANGLTTDKMRLRK
jgi:DNA-binding CsgD family transcriptional regulator